MYSSVCMCQHGSFVYNECLYLFIIILALYVWYGMNLIERSDLPKILRIFLESY